MGQKKFFLDESIEQRLDNKIIELRFAEELSDVLDDLPTEMTVIMREWNGSNSVFRNPKYSSIEDAVYAGRKNLRRGDYWHYNHPSTQERARKSRLLPWELRQKAFASLKKIKSPTQIGIKSTGLRARDSRFRLMPLVHAFEGARLYTYSESVAEGGLSTGIDIDDSYVDSPGVGEIGAIIRASVPSRTKGGRKYSFTLRNVPVVNNREKRVIIWNLDHENVVDWETGEPHKGTTMHEEYLMDYDLEKRASVVWWYPHHIAAYHKFAAQQWAKGNHVPMDMNPFPVPALQSSREHIFLKNRVLLEDSHKKGRIKMRPLHLDEISNIEMVRAANKSANVYLFNLAKKRDGKLRDYSWSLE